MKKKPKQKRDEELYKIQTLINSLKDFEMKMYRINLGSVADVRVRQYIAKRYRYFFDWINE